MEKAMKDALDLAIEAKYKGCKTYEQWRRAGRQVLEGETCFGHIDGKAVFQKSQTKVRRYQREWGVSVRTPFFSWNSDDHPRDPWSIADQCDCEIPF